MDYVDYILIGFTLAAGVVGTLWKNPSKRIQIGLIVLLGLSSLASVMKVISDKDDKKRLETLTISSIIVPNPAYDKIYQSLDKVRVLQSERKCHHTADGMSCFDYSDKSVKDKPVSLVLNRFELARLYDNNVRDIDNTSDVEDMVNKLYIPADMTEEFKDKLGILGTGIIYEACKRFPDSYEFDTDNGIVLYYKTNDKITSVKISSKEISMVDKGPGSQVFTKIGNIFRGKISESLPTCKTE